MSVGTSCRCHVLRNWDSEDKKQDWNVAIKGLKICCQDDFGAEGKKQEEDDDELQHQTQFLDDINKKEIFSLERSQIDW